MADIDLQAAMALVVIIGGMVACYYMGKFVGATRKEEDDG